MLSNKHQQIAGSRKPEYERLCVRLGFLLLNSHAAVVSKRVVFNAQELNELVHANLTKAVTIDRTPRNLKWDGIVPSSSPSLASLI